MIQYQLDINQIIIDQNSYLHFNGFIRETNTFPEFLAHGITYLKPKDSDTKNPSKI
jgi:hypothetical protein